MAKSAGTRFVESFYLLYVKYYMHAVLEYVKI